MLELIGVTKTVGGQTHIHPTDLALERGSLNVLLGPTLSGKTTLMRLMAGLDQPSAGRIFWQGRDVTGQRVQDRGVAMVYQQFINYPSMTVYENIASPLKVAGMDKAEIDRRVMAAADLLRLRPMLKRRPSELSGGQQQRTAIARAIVKDSDLILLDEPLANLDYKLREELRDELPRLFAGRNAIVVYATTEPVEALLFGGNTATLHEGRVTQFGTTSSVYREPKDLVSAQVFSDPPINMTPVEKRGDQLRVFGGKVWPAGQAGRSLSDGSYILGIRPHHVTPLPSEASSGELEGRVLVTELSGSESVIHLDVEGKTWVSQSHGMHPFEVGTHARLHVDMDQGLFFSPNGERVS